MNMNKKIFFTIVLAMNVVFAMAQKLPNWVFNKPKPTNDTYLYVVESATGQTEIEARNRAIAEVMRTTAMLIGMPFEAEEISRALQSGRDYSVISAQFDIPIHKVCEYVDKEEAPCRIYILCQVAKVGDVYPLFDDFNACYDNKKHYAEDALYVVDGYSIFRNGMELDDDVIRTMFANSTSYYLYDSGRKMENFAFASWFGVFALWGSGMVLLQSNDEEGEGFNPRKDAMIFACVFGGCGLGLIVSGIVCYPIGKTRIRKAVDLYNNGSAYSQSNLEFEYGLTGNGVYLSFSF